MTAANESPVEPEQGTTAAPPESSAAQEPAAPAKRQMSAERLAEEIARLDRLLLVAVLIFAFLLGSFAARNSDFWMHLAAGRAIVQGNYTFGTDPFAYTTTGVYWANHSWLSDVILYGLTQALGGIDRPSTGAVLVFLKALLVVLLAGLLLAIRRKNQSAWLPAVCVGLGLLVLSPRLFLQPTVISFLFVGVTLFLLAREGKQPRTPTTRPLGLLLTSSPARLYALPVLFLFWVNLDSWFLLGPLLLALCLIGDFLQEKVAPLRTADDSLQPGELRTQVIALLLGLAACLVNPHHFRAFTLPPEVHAMLQPVGLRSDPWFAGFYISPLTKEYYSTATTGYNVAGLAYFVLVAIGMVSFGVNSAGTRGWRTFVFLIFLVLSAWNQRFIPFFAIVAGPIAALNLQDFVADRYGLGLPTREAGRGWALAGRGLTFLALMLLILGTWIGLLHANAGHPQFARRVDWSVEVKPSLRKTAEQLAAWREAGLLPEDSRGFASNPDIANYFAWFCPAEKGFLDYRHSLFPEVTGDYLALNHWISGRPEATPRGKQPEWQRVFQGKRIDHLILYGSQSENRVGQLLQDPQQWTLLYLDGRTTIFGWNGAPVAKETGAFARLKFNPGPRAFGPNPDRAPPEGMQRAPRPMGDWDRFWQSAPLTALDTDEAAMDLLYFNATKQQWQNARLTAAQLTSIAGYVTVAGSATNPAAGSAALSERLGFVYLFRSNQGQQSLGGHGGELVARDLRDHDQGPPAAPLIAVRAARRAVAATPDDPSVYLALGNATWHLWSAQENYWAGTQPLAPFMPMRLRQFRQALAQGNVFPYLSPWITRSINRRQLLRQVQVVTALEYAVKLKPDRGAHGRLAEVYWGMGYFDLALDHFRAAIEQLKQAPPPEDAARKKDFEFQLNRQEQFLKEVEKEVEELRNDYELHTKKLPPHQQRLAAFAPFGLAKQALTALEQADITQLSPPEADLMIYLLVTTGQTSKVTDDHGKPGVLPDTANIKKAMGRNFHISQALLSAAVGDYRQASKSLAEAQPPAPKFAHPPLLDILQAMTFTQLQPHPLVQLSAAPFLRQQLMQAQGAIGQQQSVSNFYVLRGLVALDEGDVDAAKQHFRAALQTGAGAPPFESRPIAVRYLKLIEENAPGKPEAKR